MPNTKNIIVENFTVDPSNGFVALAVGIRKTGYQLVKLERKGTKAKAIFEKFQNKDK